METKIQTCSTCNYFGKDNIPCKKCSSNGNKRTEHSDNLATMKTKGGFKIENFKKLETPIKHGNLAPHIYGGIIRDVPTYNGKKEDFHTTWDAFGKCSNWKRSDCFIDIPEQP